MVVVVVVCVCVGGGGMCVCVLVLVCRGGGGGYLCQRVLTSANASILKSTSVSHRRLVTSRQAASRQSRQ